MANTNHVAATVGTMLIFLTVMIAPKWSDAQPTSQMDPVCLMVIDIVEVCYITLDLVPSKECCKDLKSSSNKQVTCLCDDFIAHPSTDNLTRIHYDEINTACGVIDKFACKGGEEKKEEGSSSSNTSTSSNGKDNGTHEGNGGKVNNVALSMAVFALVASLIFVMF